MNSGPITEVFLACQSRLIYYPILLESAEAQSARRPYPGVIRLRRNRT